MINSADQGRYTSMGVGVGAKIVSEYMEKAKLVVFYDCSETGLNVHLVLDPLNNQEGGAGQ